MTDLGPVKNVEDGARWRKVAYLLAALLKTQDVGSYLVANLPPDFWEKAQELSGLENKPSPETVGLLLALVTLVDGDDGS